jgi:suppressor of ftsI
MRHVKPAGIGLCAVIMCSAALHAQHEGHTMPAEGSAAAWRMPPMNMTMPMLPGLETAVPKVAPWLPGSGVDPATLPAGRPREVVELSDGDTLTLDAMKVRRTIYGKTFTMYGFNGQYPGPLIKVKQNSTITVQFQNHVELPSSIHWHGVRVENRFDGVPGVTQKAVEPGETFVYRVNFKDAGIYWYHPHHREDIQMDLGLYGNILVASPRADYYSPVNREEVLMLDDLLVDEGGLFPWGREGASHTLMGRFGNVMLVNGEPLYRLNVKSGEVVRFFLTNVSNTRTFNVNFGMPVKLVAADVGKFEREVMVESVVLAPAQRYVVEARFDKAGPLALTNKIQAVDHFLGEFVPHTDTLGAITVSADAAQPDNAASFRTLRANADVTSELSALRAQAGRPVDKEVVLSLKVGEMPPIILQLMSIDTLYVPPVEWNDAMPDMNWISSEKDTHWILRDRATGAENMNVKWEFKQGDIVKIRIFNDPRTMHPMQHPIHLHGQRFLMVAQDQIPMSNLAWMDTAIVPVGSSIDILVEMSNPGEWMLHCHIAEHLHAGMQLLFSVK